MRYAKYTRFSYAEIKANKRLCEPKHELYFVLHTLDYRVSSMKKGAHPWYHE